jgi:EAL domain-containing protein (putative c-di-GMP-specific phosphodiesterase class I)
VADDDRSAAICHAMISLGHSLGLTLVAEGVETQAQLDWLHRHHCDQVQGYLLARPMDLARTLEHLAAAKLPEGYPGR